MRILFAADVSPDPNSGAAGTEWQTIQAMRTLGHEVEEIWADDMTRRIRHGNLHYLLELPRAFRSAIQERCLTKTYDVIHVNQGHCYLAANDHVRRRRRGVFVCRSHGLDDHMEIVLEPWRRRLGVRGRTGLKALLGKALDAALRRHDRLAYRYSSGVIVSSSIDQRFLVDVRHVQPERVARIPQAPAAAFVKNAACSLSSNRLVRILHVGGFAYWKGVHAVAEAVNLLFAQSEKAEMTWVCRESEHDAVRALLEPHSRKRVDLLPWIDQDELVKIYDRHGVFLAPSLFDGFGKVFLEAMARGLCVIATPTGGMRDIIRDQETGFIVGFHDPKGIANAVSHLWSHPEHAASVAALAAQEARRYSWPRVARETISFYERLLVLESAAGN